MRIARFASRAESREGSIGLSESKSTYTQMEELVDLVKAYVKQETVDPLRTMGKRFGLGLAAAVLFGMSAIFFSLGLLRVIERYLDFLTRGILSSVPYVLGAILLALTLYLVWARQTANSDGEHGG